MFTFNKETGNVENGKNAGFIGRTVVETVEGGQPPLSREAVLRFQEAARPHVEWLERVHRQLIQDYEQSCREQIKLRTVVKPNYVKLEIVMRPGKPQERCLDLARQLKARLDHMREVLERNRS